MKILKKLIIALILGLFLCFGIKEEIKVNAVGENVNIYGSFSLINHLNFVSGDSWSFDIEPNKLFYRNSNYSINGVRVRIVGGTDYLLEYNYNNTWIVAYSEARGEWDNDDYQRLSVDGFLLVDIKFASFLNSNFSSLFDGYKMPSGTYYLSNKFNKPENITKEMSLRLTETSAYEFVFYENNGFIQKRSGYRIITFNNKRITLGSGSNNTLSYNYNTENWTIGDTPTTGQILLIPNVSLTFITELSIHPSKSTDMFINDPTYWLVNEGFVERYNINWTTETNIAILPYKPQFINGDTIFSVNKKFSITNLVGSANYEILSDTSFKITNIKSNIKITITEYRIKSSVDISVSSIGSVSGDFTFDSNQFNIILDTRVNFNITLTILKSSGYLKNIGPLTDIIGINNVASDSSVIYSYFGENFSLLTITKKVNGEEVGSKRISSDSLSQDRVINALDLFGNDDNFFTLTEENTTYSINLGLQFEGIPTDEVKVKNAMETIFETFKSFLSLNIGWLNIGGLIASILVLAILVFVVKLWKGGS